MHVHQSAFVVTHVTCICVRANSPQPSWMVWEHSLAEQAVDGPPLQCGVLCLHPLHPEQEGQHGCPPGGVLPPQAWGIQKLCEEVNTFRSQTLICVVFVFVCMCMYMCMCVHVCVCMCTLLAFPSGAVIILVHLLNQGHTCTSLANQTYFVIDDLVI